MTSSKRLVQAGVVAAAALAVSALVVVQLDGDDATPAGNTTSADGDPRIVQPGAPGQPGRELSEEEYENLTPPGHTAADVAFMQGMIHHHAQALEMTALVPDRAEGSDLPLLAERVEVTQRDEIALMERWLTDRGQQVPTSHSDHESSQTELMPGMLTEAELAQLEQAGGAEFNRLFLQFMIRHHEGALVMVDNLFATGGGVEPQSNQFAIDIEADQRIEIRRMHELLAQIQPDD